MSTSLIPTKIDNWEKLAFYPHVLTPFMLLVLMIVLIGFENAWLAAIFMLPLLGLSMYNNYLFITKSQDITSTHYALSFGVIIFSVFFPYLLLISAPLAVNYTITYLLLIVPLFMGHIYSGIYYLTKSQLFPPNRINLDL